MHTFALIGGFSGLCALVFALFAHAHRLRSYRSPGIVTGTLVLSENGAWSTARTKYEGQRDNLNAAFEAGKQVYRDSLKAEEAARDIENKEQQRP